MTGVGSLPADGSKKRQHPKMLLFVRAKGLEPIRTRHQILSLACLPISTRPLAEGKGRKKATDFKTILNPASYIN